MAVIRPDVTIARRFLDTAERDPTLPALHCGELTLSYHSAAAVMQRAAAALTVGSADPAAPIAILGRLDAWTPLLLLAAFSSGRTVCVLDNGLPAARLHELLADLAPALIVSTDAQHTTLITDRTPFRCLPPEQLLNGPVPDIVCREQLDSAALIQYSSGTTGRPKGIVRSQRALIDHTWIHYADHAPQPGDAIASLYHPAYGAATSDIFAALLSGALLQIIDPTAQSPSRLAAALLAADLTHLHLHAALLKPLSEALPADARFSRLRSLRPSDRTDGTDLQRFAAFIPSDCTVHHTLSSIEAGPLARFQQPAGATWLPGPLSVGRPLPGISLRLLDEHGHPVAPGTIGRIEVSGPGVALGYWRDPERTAEVFCATADPSVRTFRSSDLACLLPSGALQLHGRADRRVKIRGHSVALDAVEQALLALPGVAAAAAVALPDRHGNLRLFAYVSPAPGTVCDPLRLAALLRRQREAAIQPQRIVVLEQLPQRPNGKIDYQALPPPGQARPDLAVPFVAPVTRLEQQIAALWADILELDTVGLDDPFMLLGGDSIRALHLLHRLETVIGRRLPANLLIAADTVRQQAALAAQPATHAEAAPSPAAPQHSRLWGTFARLLFGVMRSIVLLLLAVGLIDRRYRRQRQLLEQLADTYGCRQQRDQRWRRSVLVNLLLNKPFFLGPQQVLTPAWRERYERLTTAALTPVCLEGFADLEQAYQTGNGVILVTYHSPAKAIRKLVLGRLLNSPPISTVSGVRANQRARTSGRSQAADLRGSAAYHGLTALQRGDIIAFASDTISRFDTTHHVLFNRQTRPISSGFAEVALLCNAAILPTHHRCDDHGRVTVIFGTPFTRPDPTLPHEQHVTALLQQYADWLASAIADDPAMLQWRFLPRELAAAVERTAAPYQKSP